MKRLYVIRHAKSSWDGINVDDFDRPLNSRGKRDAPRMGKRLKEKNVYPDLILSSPAKRALSTTKRIAKEIKFPKDKIKSDRALYHPEDEVLLEVIRGLKDKHSTVVLVSHNPGLTDFVNSLMTEALDIDNVPTCGIVAFQFNTDEWKNINWGTGHMLFFDYPKSRED